MMIPVVQWLTIIVCGGLFIVLLRAIFKIPSRDHCLNCHYNIQYIDSVRCPECGLDSDEQSRKYRKRKWVRVITLSTFLLLDSVLGIVVWSNDFVSHIPDSVLATIVPVSSNPTQDNILYKEMTNRLSNGLLTCDANRIYVKRQVIQMSKLDSLVVVRDQRIATDPVLILNEFFLGINSVLPVSYELICENAVLFSGYRDAYRSGYLCNGGYSPPWQEQTSALPASLLRNGTELQMKLIIRQIKVSSDNKRANEGTIVCEIPITRTIDIASTRDAIIAPLSEVKHSFVTNKLLDAIVVYINPKRSYNASNPYRGDMEVLYNDLVIDDDIAIGLRVEIHHNGKVILWCEHWRDMRDEMHTYLRCYSYTAPLQGDMERFMDIANKGESEFEVHIIGVQEIALRDVAKNKYWNGEIVLPLRRTDDGWETH